MNGPPAVSVVLAPNRTEACIAGGASLLLSLVVCGLFFSGALPSAVDVAWALSLLAFSLVLTALLAYRRSAIVSLRWDGERWSCAREQGVACTVGVALDLQQWMLLRVEPESGLCEWLWLRRKAQVKQWPALRRALIFSAMIADDAAGADPLGRLV
jgi:hypothetical protein